MIERDSPIPVNRQAQLLDLSRSSVYYVARSLPERDLKLMRILDELHLKWPFYGSRKLTRELQNQGHEVGRRHVDLPAFCGPFEASEMARSGLVADSLRLNSAGVRFPRAECGLISLPWLAKTLELTQKHDVTFYDASYHALAIVNGGSFVTADTRYVTKTASSGSVIALSDWRPPEEPPAQGKRKRA